MQQEHALTTLSLGLRGLAFSVAFIGLFACQAEAAETTITASYSIAIAGIPIGKSKATFRSQGSSYNLSITGSTSGLSRLVSDATADIESSGRVYGKQLLVGTYMMETHENGAAAKVNMKLNGGSVVAVSAQPPLPPRSGRVPITESQMQNVIDPISALIVPTAGAADGQAACARTLRVFDGWSRFDVRLFFREMRSLDGDTGAASKSVYVCGARYVPVGGHVPDSDSVKFMADNKDIEFWLAPVASTEFLIPYRIQIGTMIGDLTIRATSVATQGAVTKAAVD